QRAHSGRLGPSRLDKGWPQRMGRLDGMAGGYLRYRPRKNGMAHASAASSMRFCTAGSRESGELPSFFSLPDTKYMPETRARAGPAARRTYCQEPHCAPAATKKGITWPMRAPISAGPSKCSEPLLALHDAGVEHVGGDAAVGPAAREAVDPGGHRQLGGLVAAHLVATPLAAAYRGGRLTGVHERVDVGGLQQLVRAGAYRDNARRRAGKKARFEEAGE